MKEYVTDTHSLLWYLFNNPRLSKKAQAVFNKADEGDAKVYIPNIVPVEIVYLLEKAKVHKNSIDSVIALLELAEKNYQLTQIIPRTIRALMKIKRTQIPDMPDRIIAATALELDLPLISVDKKIKQ